MNKQVVESKYQRKAEKLKELEQQYSVAREQVATLMNYIKEIKPILQRHLANNTPSTREDMNMTG